MTKAIVTNDVTQMAPFTSDGWVLVDKPGVITRATFHRVVADGLLRHTSMAPSLGTGSGLTGLAAQLRERGGRLTYGPLPGRGFGVTAILPVPTGVSP